MKPSAQNNPFPFDLIVLFNQEYDGKYTLNKRITLLLFTNHKGFISSKKFFS